MLSRFLLVAVVVFPALGANGRAAEPNRLTPAERKAGWKLLFNGKNVNRWRNYKKEGISDGWVIEDGALTRKSNGAGDIVTKKQFASFELSLEYKISKGGNSGLMFHVTEESKSPWHTGPEIQVQDNVDGHDPQKAGWLYQLYRPANDPATGEITDATRPVGEWNQIHLRVTPDQCEINMNGVRYARFQKGSADWDRRVAASKFSKFENFGKPTKGHICLQDHGNVVSFRNIKVRELEGNEVPNPVDGELSLKPVLAFPHLEWAGWKSVDDRGRPQQFRPIFLDHAGDGSNRLFVGEQHGQIYSFVNDPEATSASLFLDIRDRVKYDDRQNEEGLLGLAFHPDFKQNGKFYLYYTPKKGLASVISEFRVSDDNPNRANPDSERELLRIEQPFWNHNGGTLDFGPDGYLYIGLGDGGAANDPYGNAQDLGSLLGSILRIDVDRKEDGKPYAIPADNPFVDQAGARPEIYASGLRNVWRIAFDRETGDLWCGEVGQNLWEEINLITKGGNYGWNLKEAGHPFGTALTGTASVIDPIWEYDHQVGKSITGGNVYRGSKHPELVGKYIYADYVSGKLWALSYDASRGAVTKNEAIPSDMLPVITFGEDEAGEVYFCVVTPTGKGIYTFAKAD